MNSIYNWDAAEYEKHSSQQQLWTQDVIRSQKLAGDERIPPHIVCTYTRTFGVPIDQDRKHHSNEGEPKDDAYNAVYGKKKNSGGHNQQHSTGKVERGSLPITARDLLILHFCSLRVVVTHVLWRPHWTEATQSVRIVTCKSDITFSLLCDSSTIVSIIGNKLSVHACSRFDSYK